MIHVSEDSKTGHRVIPLGRVAREVIEAQQPSRFRSEYVFSDVKGQPLVVERNRKRISVQTRRVMASLGIENASFFVLRKTAATWCGRAHRLLGVHVPKDLVSVLLHGNTVQTTVDRYYHLGVRNSSR